jgi:hypothetical protein
MNEVVENEKLTIAWIACLLYSMANDIGMLISGVLALISFISLIATIIQSFKYHGTKKPASGKKITSRKRNV